MYIYICTYIYCSSKVYIAAGQKVHQVPKKRTSRWIDQSSEDFHTYRPAVSEMDPLITLILTAMALSENKGISLLDITGQLTYWYLYIFVYWWGTWFFQTTVVFFGFPTMFRLRVTKQRGLSENTPRAHGLSSSRGSKSPDPSWWSKSNLPCNNKNWQKEKLETTASHGYNFNFFQSHVSLRFIRQPPVPEVFSGSESQDLV